MMKTLQIGLLSLMLALASVVFSDVAGDEDVMIRPGDSMAKVLRVLGEPRGRMETDKSAWLYFTRGEVRLEDGVVTSVSLISEEELQTREADRALARAERIAEGQALRQRAIEDERFAERSAGEQVAFWRRFRDAYPEVDVDRLYAQALEEAAVEAERVRTQQRIAALEHRVADAESQARRAEAQAQQAQQQAQWSRSRQPVYTAPVVYWGTPGTRTRYYHGGSGSQVHRRDGFGVSGGGTVSVGSGTGTGVSFRFDRRGDTMFMRQHVAPSYRDQQRAPAVPPMAEEGEGNRGRGRGYVHGRSHGLGVDNSMFRW